jgi:hypothetical protein
VVLSRVRVTAMIMPLERHGSDRRRQPSAPTLTTFALALVWGVTDALAVV